MTKIALVSHTLPPVLSGQGVALFRLLKNLPDNSYCLISQRNFGENLIHDSANTQESNLPQPKPSVAKGVINASSFLPVQYYHCPQLRQVKRGASWLARLKLLQAANFPIGLQTFPDYINAIEVILKIEKCTAVVGCSGSLWDIPAAYEAANRLNVKFYAYYFDWWLYQFYWHKEISFAKDKEFEILRSAAGVFVPNEALAGELRRRYGIEPVIIRNSSDLSEKSVESDTTNGSTKDERPDLTGCSINTNFRAQQKPVRILYTGAIYGAQADAVVNLLKALKIINEIDIKLVVYTSVSRSLLKLKGISGKVEIHNHISNHDVIIEQQKADLLLLPLAFQTHYHKEVIATASPGKMSDYLASGRPIIVHAPENCFVSKFFIDNDCGLVVTKRDPKRLAEEIVKLINDPATINRYVKNAKRLSALEFDSRIASAIFYDEISK